MFADVSKFRIGSDTLKFAPIYMKTFEIPSVTQEIISVENGLGVPVHVNGDSLSYSDLNLEIPLDTNYEVYFEFLNRMHQNVDPLNKRYRWDEGFDLWVQGLDGDGKVIFFIRFKNCYISSLSGFNFDPSAELGGTNISASIAFDYMEYITSHSCENDLLEPKTKKTTFEEPQRWQDLRTDADKIPKRLRVLAAQKTDGATKMGTPAPSTGAK